MALDQLARQNRWWTEPGAIGWDRHLQCAAESPFEWIPALPFTFDRDAVYTLRGPRQVGKSTVLKRQIRELLLTGWPARRILYLDVELAGLERGRDLVEALRNYLDSARSNASTGAGAKSPERLAIFLDEVSRVDQWAGALRGLIDNDELRGATVVATGSHTRDLREGGERLPGRRGGGSELDLELLPLSFREYVALVEPELALPAPLTSLREEALRENSLARAASRPRLDELLRRYLLTGGFLTAINDAAVHEKVRAETFDAYRAAIVGEFTRAGLRESYLREVVNWVTSHLGQEFDARGLAADTDIGSKDTARSYVDNLVACYAALVSYRTPSLEAPSPAFRSPKKLHPIDPLLWHLLRAWAASDPDPWPAVERTFERPAEVGHLVESVVMVHLRRAYGDRVYYWRPDERRELDFVVAQEESVWKGEVKYQSRIDARDGQVLKRAGGGVLVTLDSERQIDESVYALTAADLLSRLDAPALAAARL